MAQAAIEEEGVACFQQVLFVVDQVFDFTFDDVFVFVGVSFNELAAAGAFSKFEENNIYREVLYIFGEHAFVVESFGGFFFKRRVFVVFFDDDFSALVLLIDFVEELVHIEVEGADNIDQNQQGGHGAVIFYLGDEAFADLGFIGQFLDSDAFGFTLFLDFIADLDDNIFCHDCKYNSLSLREHKLTSMFNFGQILTITFTLFAVIDILGSIPILVSLKEKLGHIDAGKATLASGVLMILFLLAGEPFLRLMSVDVHSFAVAGSIVIFVIGLEMILGIELFKSEKDAKAGSIVPIAFPLVAGSGTLTTIMSLKANFDEANILAGIVLNLTLVYIVLRSLSYIERLLGKAGLMVIRKFFGVILLAIAVKIFKANINL